MPRWRIDIIRSRLEHLGTVTAPNEKLAITMADEQFHVAPARQNKINHRHQDQRAG
jgi:1,2-phenylacetyl-CoA epoxidase PaaB subunit